MDEKPKKAPKRPCDKWSTPAEQRRLLSFIRDTMPLQKEPKVIPLEEICKALSWSSVKVMEVRTDLLETERLVIVDCLAKDLRPTYGYRVTELGLRFLDGVN